MGCFELNTYITDRNRFFIGEHIKNREPGCIEAYSFMPVDPVDISQKGLTEAAKAAAKNQHTGLLIE